MAFSVVRNVASGAVGLSSGLSTSKHSMEQGRLQCPLATSFKGFGLESRKRHVHPR